MTVKDRYLVCYRCHCAYSFQNVGIELMIVEEYIYRFGRLDTVTPYRVRGSEFNNRGRLVGSLQSFGR
jgi:hypothetical protein